MLKLSCPSCGAEVPFKSKASVFAVCSFCRSTLVRTDKDLELVGKMAELQDELTPMQIGTGGQYKGDSFEIVGRLRVTYSDGFWNEWYCLFSDGAEGWLAEAQGFWAMCMKAVPKKSLERDELKPGAVMDLNPYGTFVVDDIRDCWCTYSEGELPMNAVQGRRSKSVDLSKPSGGMATIEFADNETRMFAGLYVDFDDFKFKNLREIDGW